ncbi:hypothetical protein [Synechococcus sp. PCC 7336]|uniref:hypothetical protein n=1 Tax=Synechococcus sp. PCC 7336 TaxID=195250 RepID=UPI000368BB80|nr:hypothetical protein [Synechococcus sp. PCC 7336]
MNSQPWAVTLIDRGEGNLEERLEKIIEHIGSLHQIDSAGRLSTSIASGHKLPFWKIEDLDSTTENTSDIISKLDECGSVEIATQQFVEILKKDGQIVELSAKLCDRDKDIYWIIVRDGISVDILGYGEVFSNDVLGEYRAVSPVLFNWGTTTVESSTRIVGAKRCENAGEMVS